MSKVSDSNSLLQPSLHNVNAFLSLAGILSAVALPLTLLFLGGDWVTRQGAMTAYVGTVAALFVFFLLLIPAGVWFKKRLAATANTLPAAYVTLVVPIVCLLIALTVIRILSPAEYAWAALLIHTAFIPVWWFGRRRMAVSALFTEANKRAIQLFPLFYGGIFWIWFFQQYHPSFRIRSVAVLIAMSIAFTIFALYKPLREFRLRVRTHWWIWLLLGLFLCGLIIQPELPFNRAHSNPLLAPMLDIANGKVIFVDALAQYGVGLAYFLLAVFQLLRLPLSYGGLAAVLNTVYILQFAVLFLVLHKATRSLLLSLAGLGAILYFTFFAVAWPSMLRIPAQSPLRYGLTYLILAAGWIGMNHTSRFWRIAESVLLGVASLWSLEAFIYAILPLSALHFVGEVVFSRNWKTSLLDFGRRILLQVGVVLFCWAAWAAATLISTGQLLNLTDYVDLFNYFTSAQKYSYHMDFHSFWTGAVTALYVGTILALLYAGWKRSGRISGETAGLLAGLSVFGLIQYLYFFVYDIDFHLSLLCMPLLMVITIWISMTQNPQSAAGFPRLNRWIFGSAVVVSVWLCMAQTSPWFFSGIRNSLLYKIVAEVPSGEVLTFRDPYRVPPTNETVSVLAALTDKYAAEERSIAIFARPDDQTEVLLLTGKTHLLEMTDPVMCSISRSFSAHILELAAEYAGAPEYIFYDSTEGALLDLQKEAFRLLTSAGRYSAIERIGEIIVFRKSAD
jgi:hypothetical protein